MIFLDVPNKYGYQLDLKDPLVQKLYWRYKDKHHIPHLSLIHILGAAGHFCTKMLL